MPYAGVDLAPFQETWPAFVAVQTALQRLNAIEEEEAQTISLLENLGVRVPKS